MDPNPYEAPKEAGYSSRMGKPAMSATAKLLASGAFGSLVIGGATAAFLPDRMFGFDNFWIGAVGLAAAMFLARAADRYPRAPG